MILVGHNITELRKLPAQSVQCVVTSPPYWGLRAYGTVPQAWGDGWVGELGSEPTPEMFVAHMVEVFAEVWRVLRDDGTCWVNLGDSYAGAGYSNHKINGDEWYQSVNSDKRKDRQQKLKKACLSQGIKPKDLIGIPWRVAFALQQPRYLGRIKSETDRVWLAAMVDGEGCFYVHKRLVGQSCGDGYTRKSDTYSPAFEVANTHKAIVDRCRAIAGVGSVTVQEKDRRQPLWRWTVRSDEARSLAGEIYPHLVGKQQQCRIVCGMPNSGDLAEAAWLAMKQLHAGVQSDVDFQPPQPCFTRGWTLRQDVIWMKPNPMPESVQDRCTKAHEYIFLLTKSERYFFDQQSIDEPCSPSTHARLSQDVAAQIGSARANGGAKTNGNMKAVARKFDPAAGNKNNASFDAAMAIMPERRNKRSVWSVPTFSFKGAHFATFPPRLVEPCILAGTSAAGCCPDCGKPWARVVESKRVATRPGTDTKCDYGALKEMSAELSYGNRDPQRHVSAKITTGWQQSCKCDAHEPVPCTVLDPFGGSGTTAIVAAYHGRNWLLCELNEKYAELARARIAEGWEPPKPKSGKKRRKKTKEQRTLFADPTP